MPIKNITKITKKDLFKSQQISLLKSSWLVAIFAVAIVLLAFRVRDGQFVFESLFFAIAGAAVIPLYFLIVEIILLKQNKKVPACTTCEYVFTDTGIKASASDGSNVENLEIKYSSIKKVAFEKKYITLLLDKSTSVMIDKNGFESDQQRQTVENLLKIKTSKTSRLKK